MCRALPDRTSTYLASLLTPYVPRPSRPDVDVPGLTAHAICAAPFTTGRRCTWPRCSRHMCRALPDRTSTYLASLLTPYVPRPSRPDVDVPGLAAHAICAAPFVTGRRRTWPRCSRHMCRALHDRTSTYLASLLTPYVPRPSRPDVDVPGLAAHAICAAPFVTGRRRTWPRCSRHMCRALPDRTPAYLASLLTPYVPRPS